MILQTRGAVGCFLSHRLVWAEMIHRKLDQAIVFGDDVISTKFDPAILNVDLASLGLEQLRLDEWEDWTNPGGLPIEEYCVPLLGR